MEQAGFRVLFATDVESSSARTFELNRPEIPFVEKDILRIERAEVERLTTGRHVHLVFGGPPCQGFSTIGDQVQSDVRNTLFASMKRIVEWTDADCFLMENVAYLRSQYGGRYEREIVEAFERLGYAVSVATLNAADYGVPQIRQRVIFFGTRLHAGFVWPEPTHGGAANGKPPWLTVGEAIMDLAVPSTEKDGLPNHTALRHGKTVVRRYELIPEGGRLPPPSQLPAEIRRKNFGNTYKRLHRERPSLTLVPGNNAFPVHPTEHRSLTPREAARLQSFPDDYVFCGNRAQQCRLVGNAVPVKLAEEVGRAIARHVEVAYEGTSSPTVATLRSGPAIARTGSASETAATGPTAVSFFTGAGGLLLGFANAGFEVLASFDRKRIVDRNIGINRPSLWHAHQDINDMTAADIEAVADRGPVDVVFGGSPCQGFSIFGNRRFVNTRGHEPDKDDRNELTPAFIRRAVQLNPRIIVLENVKGLVSTPRGSTTYLDYVLSLLAESGYEADWRILNCADFGVPQLRERFVLVAWRPDIEFRWPQPKYYENPRLWQRPYVTVADVITDLMDPSTIDPDFSHVPMQHKPLVVERYKLIPEGGRLPEKDLPPHLARGYRSDNVRNFSHVYRRLAMNRPAITMVPGHNAFPVHPILPRTLTVREAARIQTFPDDVRFVGTRQQQCMLVGNAVPPLLATILAQAVWKALDGAYQKPGYKRDIYDLRSDASVAT
jgi:DNA-methyltransferase (dcm)/DNA-methyltransferase (dcm)